MTDNGSGDVKFLAGSWPVPRDRAEYAAQSSRFVDLVRGLPDLVGVYEMGNVTVPGVSDLDMLLVVREKARVNASDLLRLLSREMDAYIYMHEPVILGEQLFAKRDALVPLSSLRQRHPISGIVYEETWGGGASRYALCYGVEYLLSKVPRTVLNAAKARHDGAHARHCLVLLNSIRHTASLMRLAFDGEDAEGFAEFDQRICQLRSHAWAGSGDNARELSDLIQLGILVSCDLMRLAALAIRDAFKIGHGDGTSWRGRLLGVFEAELVTGWNASAEARRLLDWSGPHGEMRVPAEFGAYFRALSACGGVLGEAACGWLRKVTGPASEPTDAQREHCAAINEYIQFAHASLGRRPALYISLGAGEGWMLSAARRALRFRDRVQWRVRSAIGRRALS